MSAIERNAEPEYGNETEQALFELIAAEIATKGYFVRPDIMPRSLMEALCQHLGTMSQQQFNDAGIGRENKFDINQFVRSDEICWINGDSEAGKEWLDWTARLQQSLNRQLFLGLFSFESHFAHYRCGDFYKRHYDAFRGESNRILSVVVYLNPNWQQQDGGELVIYKDDHDAQGIKILPGLGTLAVFLSEEFPHEVLPANRDRYSIAGWFRVNNSIGNQLDPPR